MQVEVGTVKHKVAKFGEKTKSIEIVTKSCEEDVQDLNEDSDDLGTNYG